MKPKFIKVHFMGHSKNGATDSLMQPVICMGS